ncbi:MAG TPA: hypothetical protein VNH11_12305 [Pirellulales bacterium]|nr:hypothetical protein [Pirellulales bacterium]
MCVLADRIRMGLAFLPALVLLAALQIFAASAAAEDAEDDAPRTLFWWQYLYEVGEQHDCWFTIEELKEPISDAIAPVDLTLTVTERARTREAAIQIVSARFPWLKFIENKKHSNVIHVVDEKLLGINNYAIEKTADVDFVGLVDDIVFQLHTQVPSIDGRRVCFTGRGPGDGYTEVAFRAIGRKVRDILTDCVPRRRGYSRFLWRAETTRRDDGAQTTVEYGGLGELFQDPGGWSWPWWEQLIIAGKRLNCHFTVETIYRQPDDPKALPVFLRQDEEFPDAKALTDALSKRIPWLVFDFDKEAPGLVHVIDRDLLKLKDYALAKSVSVDYQGTPDRLLAHLGARVDNLFQELNQDPVTAYPICVDDTTPIQCNVRNRSVRYVLTAGLPLETYEAVLWHARTWLTEAGPKTRVEYRGAP